MGWLSRLFGIKPEIPERRSSLQTGFYWQTAGLPALAATRGFNQNVVGESFYRDALCDLTGGQTQYGVKVHLAAQLTATAWKGAPAVQVSMGGRRVGSIPANEAGTIHAELSHVSPGGVATAKGKIEAGFEGGDFSVKLSILRPLCIREK
jgi:hypothetical protein